MTILVLVLACTPTNAQQQQQDYLITTQGDTLRGHISFYFTALNSQQQAILPQQIHFRPQPKQDIVLTTKEVVEIEYDHRWGVAQKPERMHFYSAKHFKNGDYFYQIVWRSDSVQLVRTYEMGYPPRRPHYMQFFHFYYFMDNSGQILETLANENVKKICPRYMPNETAFLAKLLKKRKVLVYNPYVGFSRLCAQFFGH